MATYKKEDGEKRLFRPAGLPMDSSRDVVAGYRAILFLDLVDSCTLKAALGEQRYFEQVESPYLEIVHRVLAETPCRERNDTGDGMLLTFDRVEDAATAALRVQGYLRAAPWASDRAQVRIGIHGGTTRILRGGEIRGNNVDLCARLTSIALPGQVLLTRHAYDEARRFVRGHPPLEGQDAAPELAWRSHGAYPFKGFADRCEVCEIGAYGEAPLEAPAMPGAAGTTDRALKLVENLGRFIRHHPFITVAAAVALLVIVPLASYYAWSATQRLPAGTTLPGAALATTDMMDLDEFRANDNQKWFVEIVRRHQDDADTRGATLKPENERDATKYADVAVFLGEPLPFAQGTFEITSDHYQGIDGVYVVPFLFREGGWVRALRSTDYSVSNGRMTFRFADVRRGDQLRIVVYAIDPSGRLPHRRGLTFRVL
jgi:class 3 adenylate cyclase